MKKLKNTNFLKGKKVSVLGFGRSGAAAANLCKSNGANVLISDTGKKSSLANKFKLLKGIKTEFGGHTKKILGSDLIIKSPGIHNEIMILNEARKRKIPVWGEIELASRLINPHKIFAVTGTNGKTTTTSLLGEIIKRSGRKTVVAGNIGSPLAAAVKTIDSRANIVLEVSSYQLEDSSSFHPDICSILNITPDHIEHHHTMKNYINAKKKIFRNQNKRNYCILNYDDAVCRRIAEDCPSKVVFFSRRSALKEGASFSGNEIKINIGKTKFILRGPFKIPGMHNVENIMAAALMAGCAGIGAGYIRKAIESFPGVEHRIEFVAEINGVKYFNDSKGTNVDSTRVALESFDKNIWLILGGRDKGASYMPLAGLIRKKVKGIFLIGEAADKIRKELKETTVFIQAGTMKTAVSEAFISAQKGDIVLLSPACASFDQFKDYEDRGRHFKKMVKALRRK